MKRIIIVITWLMMCLDAVAGYGDEKAVDTQKTAQPQENNTFDKPLDARVEEAVSGMETYGLEIQKKIEPIQDSKKKQKTFFSKLHEYLTKYVRDGSIKELLALEAQILKKGEGPDSIYGWFWGSVHNTVLNLAGYDLDGDTPLSEKVLEIIQDKSVDDYVRSKYVIDVEGRLVNLHNKGIEVDEKVKEKIYHVLIKIIDDTNNNSRLRAEAAYTLGFIGKDRNDITEYLIKLLDDKDDLVKERTIKSFYRLNDDIRKKLILILKDRQHYSKNIVMTARKRLLSEVNRSEEGMPYIIDMLNETEDKEEFKRIVMDLQKYNDAAVMEPIMKKFKELKIDQPHEFYYYLKNNLLLDYLLQVSKEDKLLIIRLIYETAHQASGNVEIPHHYNKAIKILKGELASENTDIRLLVLNTYGSMVSAIKYEMLPSVRKDKERLLREIMAILNEHQKREKDEFLLTVTENILKKMEAGNNE